MSLREPLRNQYYVCLREGQGPIPWDPIDPDPTLDPSLRYFGKVFEAMEKSLEVSDLVFYCTFDVKRLPSYGQSVVAVVIGDEWCRIPTYSHKVRAVFKCYGTRPTLEYNFFFKPSYLNFLILLKFLQIWVKRLPSLSSYALLRLRSLLPMEATVPSTYDLPIYDIPPGYWNQLDLPVKDIKARSYDVFFVGSVAEPYPKLSVKRWLGTPKGASRRKLVAVLNKVKREHPELKVRLFITPHFGYASGLDTESYSQEMMNTKICLVPRGNISETPRFFEALRYGCVVVSEALPSRWFYDGSPAMQVEDWSDLEGIVKRLIEDERLMQRRHNMSLDWWRTKCSEAAVGAYFARTLNSPRSSSSSDTKQRGIL
jgi:hypothetical protein